MDYHNFLEYIYIRHSSNVKLGLDRMWATLEKLDNPEKKITGIHVAGTNGKGSTSAICESILLNHMHTTGLNTSPHLIDYTERFRLNGREISPEHLMHLYDLYKHCFEETGASFFEITTALAFKYFELELVDSAIFEVGLGGRLDGTNPFNSSVTVITSIAKDHTKSLGSTLKKIAFEKAGIIKPKTPVILGNIKKTPLQVILHQAHDLKSPVYILNKHFFVENIILSTDGTSFDYKFPKFNVYFPSLKLNLLGLHQAYNAALAITAVLLYFQSIKQKFSQEGIYKSLRRVNWQGRLQILSSHPLVIIDGAHNEEGITTLVKNIKSIFPNYRYHFLVAILRDKRIEPMIRDICSIATDIYISKNKSERAADIQEQVLVAQKCKIKYYVDDDIVNSAKKSILNFKDDKDMLIITGSLYTIAEILKVKDEIF